jgi:hypothetical protein
MADTPIDYAALAKQAGAIDSQPAPPTSQNSGVDYAALAKQAGATDYQAPQSQSMVTNSVGETMPADVAARHALTRQGKDYNPPDPTAGTPYEGAAKLGNFVEDVVTGLGKKGLETIQGGVALANKAAKKLDPFDSPAHPTPQLPIPAAAADTEAHGFGEGVGGFGENVLEFMSGEELLSGFSKVAQLEKLAQSSPAISNLVSRSPAIIKKIFGSAAKGAVIGGAQGAVHGAAEDKALEGAEGGAAGGAIGGAIAEGAAPGAKALARIFGLGGRTAEEAMVAAGRPSVTEDANYRQALKTAAPRIVGAAKDASLKTVEILKTFCTTRRKTSAKKNLVR